MLNLYQEYYSGQQGIGIRLLQHILHRLNALEKAANTYELLKDTRQLYILFRVEDLLTR